MSSYNILLQDNTDICMETIVATLLSPKKDKAQLIDNLIRSSSAKTTTMKGETTNDNISISSFDNHRGSCRSLLLSYSLVSFLSGFQHSTAELIEPRVERGLASRGITRRCFKRGILSRLAIKQMFPSRSLSWNCHIKFHLFITISNKMAIFSQSNLLIIHRWKSRSSRLLQYARSRESPCLSICV